MKGEPLPLQSYSLITLMGSGVDRPRPSTPVWLSDPSLKVRARTRAIGHAHRATSRSSIYFSACVPERFFCRAGPGPNTIRSAASASAPSSVPGGILGAIFLPSDLVRIGFSFQLPYWISAPGHEHVRLTYRGRIRSG